MVISAENALDFHFKLLEERGRRSRILACPDCIEVEVRHYSEGRFHPGESEFVPCEKHKNLNCLTTELHNGVESG